MSNGDQKRALFNVTRVGLNVHLDFFTIKSYKNVKTLQSTAVSEVTALSATRRGLSAQTLHLEDAEDMVPLQRMRVEIPSEENSLSTAPTERSAQRSPPSAATAANAAITDDDFDAFINSF